MTSGGATPADGDGGRGVAAGRRRRAGGLRRPEAVAVTWSDELRRPAAFVWRRRRWPVQRVTERWVVETGWWRDEGRVSRSFWRVRSRERLFDLCYDRLTKTWSLVRTLS